MINRLVSKYNILKLLDIQVISNIKMASKKDYGHYKDQMVSFGVHVQKIKDTALRFWEIIKLSSRNLARIARYSTRKRPI